MPTRRWSTSGAPSQLDPADAASLVQIGELLERAAGLCGRRERPIGAPPRSTRAGPDGASWRRRGTGARRAAAGASSAPSRRAPQITPRRSGGADRRASRDARCGARRRGGRHHRPARRTGRAPWITQVAARRRHRAVRESHVPAGAAAVRRADLAQRRQPAPRRWSPRGDAGAATASDGSVRRSPT